MRREGRQHGSVRTYSISPAEKISRPRLLESAPLAGIFSRVPLKPTNHSKFTGKCGRPRCSSCHLHPSWKSKDKIKGARTKSKDRFMLYQLRNDALEEEELDDHYCHKSYNGIGIGIGIGIARSPSPYIYQSCSVKEVNLDLDSLIEYPFISSPIHQISNEIVQDDDQIILVEEDVGGFRGERLDDEILVVEDEDMGFYDVAIVWDPIEGDEGWSLIGEI